MMRSGPVYFIRREGISKKGQKPTQVDASKKDSDVTEPNATREVSTSQIDEKLTIVESLRPRVVATEESYGRGNSRDASSLPDWLIWQSPDSTAGADSNMSTGNITKSSIQAKIMIDLTWQDPYTAKGLQVSQNSF
jgi:hypothetical protein